MELHQTFVCECNQRDYQSKARLTQHKRTQKHLSWERDAELRQLKMAHTKKDNLLQQLERDVSRLRELNLRLVEEIVALRGAP